MRRLMLSAVLCLGVVVCALAEAWATDGKGDAKGEKGRGRKESAEERCFEPDVLRQIMQDNPGLPANFLTHSNPDTPIKLSDGTTYPLYQIAQFLDANFRIRWYARKKEGVAIVSMMETRLRKLLALPEFRQRVLTHRREYTIAPKGKVSAEQAYSHLRRCDRRLGVTAGRQYRAPVGGGGGIAAPSWATWRAMNLFWHETCHCIGIGHNSGGLSGPIAGTLRAWDRQKRWNYPTIDANTLKVTYGKFEDKWDGTRGEDGKGEKNGNWDSDARAADENAGSLDEGPEDDVIDADAAAARDGELVEP